MHADRHARVGTAARSGTPEATARIDNDPLIGRVLDGRYRIGTRIARGGMAGVYQATDLRLHRTVAVKVMHPGLGDDHDFASRFVREARAAAGLSHPNIVAVYDQGEDDGTVFLAMELVPGHTLRDTISAHAPLSPTRALRLLEPVLAALAAAHRGGIVHRDVKPENVLIADDGRVKVADFGLAKAVTADTQHTATGVLIGTVSYLAPEVVVEGRADARADVYAAGVMLFELLTGRKPHAGETPIQVAYKHVHEDVAAPSAQVPGIPPYVDALVARATARDRSLRPADAGVLLHQVRRVASALAEGLPDDPELTADLALPAASAARRDEAELTPLDELMTAPVRSIEPSRERTVARADRSRHTPTARPTRLQETPLTLPAAGPAAPPASRRARRRRRGPMLMLLALVLAASVGVGAWWFGVGRYTTTPGVLGLDQAAAAGRLEQAGLAVRVGEPAYSDTVPVDHVLRTDPSPGAKVLDGDTVTLTVSLGVEQYQLPELAGQTLDAAQDALAASKLTYGQALEEWSETVPAGQVIRTEPAAGTVLRPGSVVDVYVSQGRRPIKVGSWTGEDADRAIAKLEKRGLVVETAEEHHDSVPEGDVINQSPPDGTLYKGDTVSLVVSLGPELIEVPNVQGQGQEAATEALEAAGFEVAVEPFTPYFGLGFVMDQERAGERVRKGSTITIWVS